MTDVDAIMTCSESLLDPGRCCWPKCGATATLAVLISAAIDGQLSEHTRCSLHLGVNVAVKPLVWDPLWGPRGTVS